MMSTEIQDTEAWAAFCDMRKQKGKRAPFTEFARTRILFELRRFAADGHDCEEILWNSVTNGWSGVFLVKRKGWNPPTLAQTVPSAAVAMTQDWIAQHGTEIERPAEAHSAITERLRAARAKVVGGV